MERERSTWRLTLPTAHRAESFTCSELWSIPNSNARAGRREHTSREDRHVLIEYVYTRIYASTHVHVPGWRVRGKE